MNKTEQELTEAKLGPKQPFLVKLAKKYIVNKTQLFMMLIVIICFGAAMNVLKDIPATVQQRTESNLSYRWPQWQDYYWAVGPTIFCYLCLCYTQQWFVPLFDLLVDPKYTGDVRREKVFKSTKYIFKFLYFTASSIFGYYVLRDLQFFPAMALGRGDMNLVWKDWPYFNKTPYFDYYYVGQVGYHTASLFHHLHQTPRNDFIELLLHHLITVILMVFSYMTQYSNIGCIVLFIHDWSDIPIAMTRMCTDFKNKIPCVTFFIGILTIFGYSRIFVFP